MSPKRNPEFRARKKRKLVDPETIISRRPREGGHSQRRRNSSNIALLLTIPSISSSLSFSAVSTQRFTLILRDLTRVRFRGFLGGGGTTASAEFSFDGAQKGGALPIRGKEGEGRERASVELKFERRRRPGSSRFWNRDRERPEASWQWSTSQNGGSSSRHRDNTARYEGKGCRTIPNDRIEARADRDHPDRCQTPRERVLGGKILDRERERSNRRANRDDSRRYLSRVRICRAANAQRAGKQRWLSVRLVV
jgi:hypothetical protein